MHQRASQRSSTDEEQCGSKQGPGIDGCLSKVAGRSTQSGRRIFGRAEISKDRRLVSAHWSRLLAAKGTERLRVYLRRLPSICCTS